MDFSTLLPDLIERWTGSYADLAFSLIGVAAALAALLPPPKEGQKLYAVVHALLNFLALNILRARNAKPR